LKSKKKLAFEIFISGVVVFDAVGSNAYHLPVWQFLPMWVGAMLEIEVGAKLLSWTSRLVHLAKLHLPSKGSSALASVRRRDVSKPSSGT